jgi:hypothetical protein
MCINGLFSINNSISYNLYTDNIETSGQQKWLVS